MIHREVNFCGSHDGRTFWVGACECGWQGREHPSFGATGADGARADYRSHIEEALGAESYYIAPAGCRNCGSHHPQQVLIGTHVTSAICERCGTRMLEPDNDVWNAADERMKGWRGS